MMDQPIPSTATPAPGAAPSAKTPKQKKPASSLNLGSIAKQFHGHRGMTIIVTAVVLVLVVCVIFVNTVVITVGTDDAYRAEAEKKASLTNFDTSSLNKVQQFSAGADDTGLPGGRINPFMSN